MADRPDIIKGFVEPPGLDDDPEAKIRYYLARLERTEEAAKEPLKDVQKRYGLDSIAANTLINNASRANKNLARLYRGYHSSDNKAERDEFAEEIGRTLTRGDVPTESPYRPFDDGDFKPRRYGHGDLAESKAHFLSIGQRAARDFFGVLPDKVMKSEQKPDPAVYSEEDKKTADQTLMENMRKR